MVPIPWVPNLQVQGHLPTSKTGMRNPEDGTPSERGASIFYIFNARKSNCVPTTEAVQFHGAPISLEVTDLAT